MAGVFSLSDFRVEQLEGNIEESANYGYFGGGSPSIATVDRIDFSNETTSLPESNLTQGRWSATTVSNSNYGYFAGGYIAPFYRCTIDRLDFSTEIVAVPPVGNQLTQARYMMSGVSSPDYGYFAGGEAAPYLTYPKVATIDRLDFSSETMAGPPIHGINLTEPRSYSAGVFNRNYGYFAGDVAEIDRIDFSNDTTSEPGVTLTQSRHSLTSVSASNYGYFAGGTPEVDTIDRIDFSNETTSAPGNNLTQARRLLGATSNLNYGYFGGGFAPPSVDTIDRIDFSNEIVSLPGNNLPQGRYYVTGVSGGKSVNARIRKSTDKNGKSISGKYAYYGGGYATSAPYQDIDRMEYATETMTTLPSDQELSQRRSELSAAGNSNYGYFIGGLSSPSASSKIDRMDFSNETLTDNLSLNPSAFGTFGVKRTTSLANNNYIYTAGGAGPSGGDDKEVTRMDLSTEVLTSRDMLTADRAYMSSLRTSSYGYFCGGEGPPPLGGTNKSSYQRLDFSTESVIDSSFPSMMNTKRQEFASFQSPEYGYVAGGDGSPGYQCRIERLDFSSETFNYTSNSMPEGRENVNAFCNENFGYIAGGWSPGNRSVIDRMEFSSETMSLPGVQLQKGNSYSGGTVSDNGVTHS
jgi:hypothetical protein